MSADCHRTVGSSPRHEPRIQVDKQYQVLNFPDIVLCLQRFDHTYVTMSVCVPVCLSVNVHCTLYIVYCILWKMGHSILFLAGILAQHS